MNFRAKLIVGLGVLVVGSVAAFAWWSLAGGSATTAPVIEQSSVFVANSTDIEDCSGLASGVERSRCREQAVGNIAFDSGPQIAFETLDELATGPEGASWQMDAHLIQHAIGAATLRRERDSVGRAFALGDRSNASTGSGGYYHGIILRAMEGVPDAKLGRRVERICADPLVRRSEMLAYQCLHGVGHGLMIHTRGDLPRSLESCDELRRNQDQFSCHTGAFMENVTAFMGIQSGSESRYVRDDDLLYPCTWVAQRHKSACYLQASIRMGPAVGWNWGRIAQECRKADAGFVTSCYYSAGGWAWSHSRGEPMQTLARCREMGPGARTCIFAAAAWIVGNKDLSGSEAAAMCRRAKLAERPRCFGGIGSVIRQQGSQRLAAICTKVAGIYATACKHPPRM